MTYKMRENFNKSKFLCACTNCKKSNYCYTDFACYKVFDKINCPKDNHCYGCFNNHIQTLQCNLNSSNLKIKCCKKLDYCNLKIAEELNIIHENDSTLVLISTIILVITLIVLVFVFTVLAILHRKRKTRYKNKIISDIKSKIQYHPSNHNSNKNENRCLSEMSYTSSGGGPGELIQRTISRDIYIDYSKGPIGKGRYGAVWSAKWNDDLVAVKVFFSLHEQSWSRETEIYQTCMLRHENILGYIASDIKGIGCSVNMLLITDYHPLGSLYDYLVQNTLDKWQLFNFMYSIINGLNHLHNEIFSFKYKPIIVHRDLKTKNILVKNNMECCLADFGLAIRYDSQLNKIDYGSNTVREGSVRYMAPEILNNLIDHHSINQLKSTDIYALSLVIWEMLIRLDLKLINDKIEDHRPPYYEYIQGDPPVDQMRNIVCVNKIRPWSSRFENFVSLDNDLKVLVQIMTESWKEDSSVRLTCLNIKKKIKKILSSMKN